MFFNCCRRNCCCRQDDKHEKGCCDRHNDYEKCDKYDNERGYDKKEKNCCHIGRESKYGWNNDSRSDCDNRYDRGNGFNNQSYYGEYNSLGYFNQSSNSANEKENDRKLYQKEDDRKPDFDKGYYTPNWDNDKDCKCEKDKHEKCDNHDWNKYCKPVKYICIPFDKF